MIVRRAKSSMVFAAMLPRLRGVPILLRSDQLRRGRPDAVHLAPGFEGSPSVVKEACAMGLPGGDSRYEMVKMLTDQVMRVVATGGRSNGRDRVAHLSCAHVAGRLLEVYREIAH